MKIKNIMMLGALAAVFTISGAVADVAVAPRVTAGGGDGGGVTLKVTAGTNCSDPGGLAACGSTICACVTAGEGKYKWVEMR
ncbi:MAG: hypothetical protein FWF97_03185 [Alphaproteobacteria bacterium]|nr:hypothetical protein [Alphaproteobacteria bacterium]